MQKIIFIFLFTLYSYGANQFNISLENKSNYSFEDYLFTDINTSEHLLKKSSFNNLNLNLNLNDMIGSSYEHGFLDNNDKFESQEIYLGTNQSKYIGYKKTKQYIQYKNRDTTKDIEQFTFFNILTLSKSDFETINTETFVQSINGIDTSLTKEVYRKYNLEINALSTENLYEKIKEDSLQGEDYFYGVIISKNFLSRFRIYGVGILSYEHYDYSEGEAYYLKTDTNGTVYKESIVRDPAKDDYTKLVAVDGRYKGYGYGYKLTAEAYWNNLSIFITSYLKNITLKNYHSGVKYKADGEDAPANIIAIEEIHFLNRYTILGLRYRF